MDTLSKIMYNPYVNENVLDSILSWREAHGCHPLEFDWDKSDTRMRNSMFYASMDISNLEKAKVVLGRFEEFEPECNCENNIVVDLLDDSLVNSKNIPFHEYFLDSKIKRIEVYYYQVRHSANQEDPVEHLLVKIKKRFRLLSVEYKIY
jgi:hypothetical protein